MDCHVTSKIRPPLTFSVAYISLWTDFYVKETAGQGQTLQQIRLVRLKLSWELRRKCMYT